MELLYKICFLLVGISPIMSFPRLKADSSLLVTTEVSSPSIIKNEEDKSVAGKKPEIYEMKIKSNITNRFAENLILSKVRNPEDKAQETVFSVILPETAFITGFTMEIDGKNYTAYIKEKEEAKQAYDQAVASGIGAAHVAATARDSSRFTVSVNVEPQGKVTFYLFYEELLKRKESQYEMIINIHPNQPVPNLNVDVTINEQKPLKFVRTPNLRSGNEIRKTSDDLHPQSTIDKFNDTTAIIHFSPSIERQKTLAESLGTEKENGFSGQFIVQYDVERDLSGGQVLLNDGYFVHFFAPDDIQPLPKYVVFVLDTSGSMYDEKLSQLKQGMRSIMGDMKESDKFHVVEFSTFVNVWDVQKPDTSVTYPTDHSGYWYRGKSKQSVQETTFPPALPVNADNIKLVNERINKMTSAGGTNIYEALKVALWLVESEKVKDSTGPQPMIIFLTDGDATVGVTSENEIIKDTTEFNKYSTPIFSLSFGAGADRNLLEKMSLQNSAFARHIYEGSDASLQLEDFYRTIASPLLRDVEFKYTSQTEAVTKYQFPILFGSGEFIVAGKMTDPSFSETPKVLAHGFQGPIELKAEVVYPVTSMERLWAYLTTQQYLEAAKSQNKTLNEKKALDIALKYSFVTPVSSLVVIKPNDTGKSVDTEKADTSNNLGTFRKRQHKFRSKSMLASRRTLVLSGDPAAFGGGAPLAISGSGGIHAHYAMMARPAMTLDSYDADSQLISATFPAPLQPPAIYRTTTFKPSSFGTTSTTPKSAFQTLKDDLPWISALLSSDEESIALPSGIFKLGLHDSTPEPKIECPKTINDATGSCSLLHECRQVYSLLTNAQSYEKYFCKINEFAGVCCPTVDS